MIESDTIGVDNKPFNYTRLLERLGELPSDQPISLRYPPGPQLFLPKEAVTQLESQFTRHDLGDGYCLTTKETIRDQDTKGRRIIDHMIDVSIHEVMGQFGGNLVMGDKTTENILFYREVIPLRGPINALKRRWSNIPNFTRRLAS